MLKSVASLDYIKFSLAAIEKGLELCAQKAKQVGSFSFFFSCFYFLLFVDFFKAFPSK